MIVIRYATGATQPGVLLALRGGRLRIAAQGSDDILEFCLHHEQWISEACEPVTFDFPLAVFEAIGIVPPPPSSRLKEPEIVPSPAPREPN